jgi:hypothetical protein
MTSDLAHTGHTSRSGERCGVEVQRGDTAGTHLAQVLGVCPEIVVTGQCDGRIAEVAEVAEVAAGQRG